MYGSRLNHSQIHLKVCLIISTLALVFTIIIFRIHYGWLPTTIIRALLRQAKRRNINCSKCFTFALNCLRTFKIIVFLHFFRRWNFNFIIYCFFLVARSCPYSISCWLFVCSVFGFLLFLFNFLLKDFYCNIQMSDIIFVLFL